ncbi:MAG: lytic transglycosylase domain-containing protein [Clostridia bacterium]|nr:lytic transglycosylase domain-containing protein [Clostridia bacterium]
MNHDLIVRLCTLLVAMGLLLGGGVNNYLERQEEARRAQEEIVERAYHPLPSEYREFIEQYAEIFNLEPALIAAVILCESGFDPNARSHVNARGLMQLMPAIAEWIAETTGEPDFDHDRLYEPELNIRMGAWYLSYLAELFDNDVRKMVCAYHAGMGNVAAWLKNPEFSSDGVALEGTPFPNTAEYEARVQRAIVAYRKYHFTDGGFE